MLTTGIAALISRTPVDEDVHVVEFSPKGDPILSPSQLSTFLMCPRKWAARYIHGIPDGGGASAVAGKKMHKQLERYYKEKKAPDNTLPEGVWATALIAKTGLPLPGPGKNAEVKFKFEDPGGVWWRGSIDLLYTKDDYRHIRDHKSTSDLCWAKTEDQLKDDPQSVIYAYQQYLEQDLPVWNEWGYATREKHPQTQLVEAAMPFEDVLPAMAEHTATGKRILQLYREKPEINDLPPVGAGNGGCEAFNGCKLAGNQCRLSAQERLRAVREFNVQREIRMNAIERIKANRAAKAAAEAAEPTAIVTPPPPPAPPVVAPPPAPAPSPPAVVAPAPPVAAPAVVTAGMSIREKLAAGNAVASTLTPPPYTPPVGVPPPVVDTAPPAPAPVPSVPAAAKPLRGRAAAKARAEAAGQTQMQNTATLVDAICGEIGAGVAALITADPSPIATGGVVADRIVPVTTTPVRVAANGPFDLYVNCAPNDGFTLFSKWVAVVHQGLLETKQMTWYALASFEGTAAYQDYLRQALEQEPPRGALVVDSRSNEGRDALPVLERFAGRVTRGF